MIRTIKRQHAAISAPIADLVTYRALPTRSVEYLDPFLFLNHHGPQQYPPHNRGLPFGPHPHRGFETVTFIRAGDIRHQDSSGHESIIGPGGIQWMTAGSGLIHAETSSDAFKQTGGALEILQLWVNLPAADKMTAPHYVGLQHDAIPVVSLDAGRVQLEAVSGTWQGTAGAITSPSGIALAVVRLAVDGHLQLNIPADHTLFFYVIRGQLLVNEQNTEARRLVEFNYDGDMLDVRTLSGDAEVLLGHARPFGEPVVAHGPFVMNTVGEIEQAYRDYQSGKLGVWQG